MKLKASKIYQNINDTAVFLYKLAGTPVLVVLLVWTLSYLSLTGYYLLSDRWVVPFVAGPGQERVLRETNAFNDNLKITIRLQEDRASLSAQFENVKQSYALAEKQFQLALTAFADEERTQELDRTRFVVSQEQTRNLQALRKIAREKFARRLISAEQLERELTSLNQQETSVQRQPAQVSNPSIRPILLEYQKTLNRDHLLSQLMDRQLTSSTSRYLGDMLKVQADLRKGQADKELILTQIRHIDEQLRYYQPTLKSLSQSPFVQASKQTVNLAFVPYQNISRADRGSKVYACRLYFVLCREVGTVSEVYPTDETVWQHPFFNNPIRGTLLRLALKDTANIQKVVLMLDRPPLGF